MQNQETTFLKKTLEQLSLGVYWKNKTGHYVDCNFYFCQLLGFKSIDLLIGKTDEDLNLQITYKNIVKSPVNQAEFIIEKNIICADGIKKYLLFHESEVSGDAHTKLRVGVVEEITFYKKEILTLKKDKRKTKTYLENIIANMPGSVYWKDTEGVYLGCNDYVAKIAGVASKKEVIGKTDYAFSWKNEAPTILKTEREVMESKTSRELEISGRLSDGTKATFLVIKAPLYNDSGEVAGILATSLDITERKKLEENLKTAKERAEVANKAKTEFLENMRHDIRTPLSGIVGCAQLIQMQADDPKKVAEYADDLIQSSDALLEFLNKILESIQVASGEIPLLKKKFNLYHALEQVVHLNKPQASIKKLSLHVDYDKTIPAYLMGDPVRVQRILLELVTNALKFTDKGEIKITARLMKNKTRSEQEIIQLSVSDTGIGIPLDKQHEVYTRFKRLMPSYQGIYPGTGLGLSLVKQFIDDLGGELHLKSKPNQGSTFTCIIPFQESLLTTDENGLDTIQLEETFDTGLSQRSINVSSVSQETLVATGSLVLVVEDNAIAAKVAQGVMSKLNCQIDIAGDGKSALTSIEKNHYDLILMDIGLPDNDGGEVTRRIRLKQWKSNPSVPIVGLTAHINAENKRRCIDAGMNAIYTKPLTPAKAAEIVNAFIPHHQKMLSPAINTDIDSFKDLAVLDIDRAVQFMGSKEFVKEALALLVSGLTEELAVIKQRHQEKDWQAIKAMAHKWRGGAGYCGTRRLEEACKQLETYLQTGSLKQAEDLYQQLIQAAEAAKEAAKKYIS